MKSHRQSASVFSSSESAVLGLTDLAPQTLVADYYTVLYLFLGIL